MKIYLIEWNSIDFNYVSKAFTTRKEALRYKLKCQYNMAEELQNNRRRYGKDYVEWDIDYIVIKEIELED